MIIILTLLLIVVVVNSDSSFGSGSSAVQQGPFFTPCTFPTPHQSTHYHLFCDGHHRRLPYICDLHRLISPAGVQTISLAFAKYRHYFMFNQSLSIGVVLVRQLAPPPTEAHVYSNRLEYGCLFGAGDDELDGCVRMDVQTVSRFVHRWKSYTNIYASILYERWFRVRPPTSLCQLQQPNILMLVAVDGLLNDPRMHPIIRLHSAEPRLSAPLANVQFESVNAILQGLPMHRVIEDLLLQVGDVLAEFHSTGGLPRRHFIPLWALQVFGVCVLLIVAAVLLEHYIVRRKQPVKTSSSGLVVPGARSKTHLMF